MTDERPSPRGPAGLLATGGILSGLLASVGATCCVLPLVLIHLGAGTALAGSLAVFAPLRPWFLLGAAELLIVAGGIAWRRGRLRGGFLALLIVGGAVLAAALILPAYERELIAWVRSL